jgi:hypothetical protein
LDTANDPPPEQARRKPRRYTPYVDRGNSVPAPWAYGTFAYGAILPPHGPALVELSLGGAIGLGPRVWIDGAVGTLRLAPHVLFHSLQIGPNVLLVDTRPFELDATLHVSTPSDSGLPIEQIEPGLMTVGHIGHALRVDSGVFFDVNPGPTTTLGFRVPAAFAFQITDHLYAAINTGVGTRTFADARNTTAIPLGATLGWSGYVGRDGSWVIALMPSVSLPELVKPWGRETFRPGFVTWSFTFLFASKY